jgi:hypothetical protein
MVVEWQSENVFRFAFGGPGSQLMTGAVAGVGRVARLATHTRNTIFL